MALLCLLSVPAIAQDTSSQSGSQNTSDSQQTPPTTTFTVTVVGTTPLVDVTIPVEEIAAPVQTLTGRDIDNSGALDIASYLNLRLNGVNVNETQSNPFQPDVSYRGYTASPLLGTPQGLSVYMDGVRLNQPFGDVVSWDLIPRMAIFSGALMPGSNPLFGLNTLGGALSIQTKDGRNSPGTTLQAVYGSDMRRYVEFEHGGRRMANGVDWYVAGNLFAEDGWRDDSPSDVRQLFGKLAWRKSRGDVSVTLAYADNELNGNGLQEIGFLDRDYASVYTKPDETDNRSTFLNVTTHRTLNDRLNVLRRMAISATSAPRRSTVTSTRSRSTSRSINLLSPSRRPCSLPGTSLPRSSAPTPRTHRFRICAVSPTCSSWMNHQRSATASSTDRRRINRTAASPHKSHAATSARRVVTSSRLVAHSIGAPLVSFNQPSSATSIRIAVSLAPERSATASREVMSMVSRSTHVSTSTASRRHGACSPPTR